MSVDFSTDKPAGRAQQKCEAILTAAAKAFLIEGFERANMDEIAAVAGVSKRTIYHHYTSKEGLFEAVAAGLAARVRNEGEVRWDASRSIEEQVLEIARHKLSLFADRYFSGLARMVLGTFAAQPELARRTMVLLDQCDNGILGWIEAAQAAGRLRGIDKVEADQLFGSMLMSMLVWPMLSGHAIATAARHRQVEAIAQMFAGYLTRADMA